MPTDSNTPRPADPNDTTATADVLARTILAEVDGVLAATSTQEVEQLSRVLSDADRVMVSGEGRSGFMARAFAMRLMHLGLRVHVLGETTTPALAADDTLIAVSGSGTTAAIVRAAQQAEQVGAAVHAVTTDAQSPLAALADTVLIVPAATKHRRAHEVATLQPLSSLFDQATHLLLDVVCLHLARARGVDNAIAKASHATE